MSEHQPISVWQRLFAFGLVLALIIFTWQLGSIGEGRDLSFSLALGILFGITLQRSRFCFFCMTRDFIDKRDARGLLGLIVALAVGSLGYIAIFGAMLPIPAPGRLPPDAHIGPISWVLALAALVFGTGMSISGSCISAHLYRLGEGATASLFALIGVLLGFIAGFQTWNYFYLNVIQAAPVVWLPNYLGYGGTLLLQLFVFAIIAFLLTRLHKNPATQTREQQHKFFVSFFEQRWPTYIGGLLIGFLATIAFFRIAPLGVTAELGSIARTFGSTWQLLPERLEGLDTFTGCATVIKETLFSNNGLFILGLVIAAWASAIFAGQFKPELPGLKQILRNISGGILMGWGAMTALGCTVGTLLSGIMAGALSGWVFALFCLLGLWGTWLVRRAFLPR
jgi:uncharacterized membrane protein YedE/YeeE